MKDFLYWCVATPLFWIFATWFFNTNEPDPAKKKVDKRKTGF